MDDYIEEQKEKGDFTPDDMRWAEYLRGKEKRTNFAPIRQDDFTALFDEDPFVIDPGRPWRENYEIYLRSRQWKRTRGIAIYEARNRCERCGRFFLDGKGLEVHHKTYENLGNEPLSDLEVLCHGCHEVADRERAERSAQRSYDNLETARWEGWRDKVDPEGYEDEEYLYERYERWRESRDDDGYY